jgi:non-canonical poly(A) RNA polymerase PAPD5/7
MEESSSEIGDSDSNPPRKKRAVEPVVVPTVEQPKWSNPDPYTALPPPDETQVKRPDFVKLIRKARISATAADPLAGGDAVTTNVDFISFGADDDDFEDENAPPENAPSGPKIRQQHQTEDVGAGKKRTRDDQVKVFTGKSGKVSFNSEGDIISIWKARLSDNGSPWLELMEPTMHIGTR